MFTVLMVCTGNTCRSPMAAAIFQDIADKAGYCGKITAVSAGVSALPHPASKNACAVMAKRGLSLKEHSARQLTEKQIVDADLVLTMTAQHKNFVLSMAAQAGAKVFTLPEFAETAGIENVGDPYGAGEDVYAECAEEIAGLLCKSWRKIEKLAGNIGINDERF